MTRAYVQRARAEDTEARREAVLRAAWELFMAVPYARLTLHDVADRAGVSVKTITRQFGTLDALGLEVLDRSYQWETGARPAAPHDVAGVARALSERYEQVAAIHLANRALEDEVAFLGRVYPAARRGHLAWLAECFGRWLPDDDDRRTPRLMALFVATEIGSYWTLRTRLGQGPAEAQAVMRATLDALVAAWEREDACRGS